MFSRFLVILNELEALGKTYTEVEKVMKILRSLPRKWETKVTAIQEENDLTKLSLEELIRSLMTYEIELYNHQRVEENEKSIAFMAITNDDEEENSEKPMMIESSFTAGPSSQPSFTELPSQAPHAPVHPPCMDLSAQISSLGTRMEELAVVHDTRFYSMEDCIDQYQADFTSQFEHLVQRIEHLESRQENQHEEMMAYLRSVFPPPPPQP
ncbi:hypothetical protein VitviT2T_028945 [Vitis vinifera]|uniref:UBN2 domain-containing protein n=1 Tax=Vitis vinifera TaxID=29760 RepID=A0ABY9DV81_VITVI|nr:hypothetical protein VitviT2T_028945 [Vitis vinifera]